MDISELSPEIMDRLNSNALDFMVPYYQIERLPPKIQHNRINVNPIFQDHIVVADVYQKKRYLDIKP